jgi:hypothetical protein
MSGVFSPDKSPYLSPLTLLVLLFKVGPVDRANVEVIGIYPSIPGPSVQVAHAVSTDLSQKYIY